MADKPYKTSRDLIEAIKRDISIPVSYNTYGDNQLLSFLNDEMDLSMVPSVMEFHEDYFVRRVVMPLEPNLIKYNIPSRAIGGRLNDLKISDTSGSFYPMTRIQSGDKDYYNSLVSGYGYPEKYYLENDNVVLASTPQATGTSFLNFFLFMRPNRLVVNERAAIIRRFVKNLTIDVSLLASGDIIKIGSTVFTAVVTPPASGQFQIGADSIITATNLAQAIVAEGTYDASNGTPSTAIVSVFYTKLATTFDTDAPTAIVIATRQGVQFTAPVSTVYTDPITNESEPLFNPGTLVDFLQTNGAHKTYNFDTPILPNGVSVDIMEFNPEDLKEYQSNDNLKTFFDIKPGDYVCLASECIIPQMPSDLHVSLVKRTSASILSSMGDVTQAAAKEQKVMELDQRQATLLDNRVDNSPLKITQRRSILNYQKNNRFRRF